MARSENNPFRGLTTEKRTELLAAFLQARLGDEDDFERLLQRGADAHDGLANRTPSRVLADEASAKELLEKLYNDDDEPADSSMTFEEAMHKTLHESGLFDDVVLDRLREDKNPTPA